MARASVLRTVAWSAGGRPTGRRQRGARPPGGPGYSLSGAPNTFQPSRPTSTSRRMDPPTGPYATEPPPAGQFAHTPNTTQISIRIQNSRPIFISIPFYALASERAIAPGEPVRRTRGDAP